MPDRTHRVVHKVSRGTLSVALVLALAGMMFVANARLAQGTDERHPQNLADLATVEEARVARLQGEVVTLHSEVDQLTAKQARLTGLQIGSPGAGYDVAAGKVAVTGPGITVSLTDAPAEARNLPKVHPDDLVVHQQDLQAVINALWAGGAEAMSLMDQRVISTSAFQCIGNVLSLQGRRYSPPFVVRAVGDPKKLRAALAAAPAVQIYLQWVDAVGLGWKVTTAQDPLNLPAYEGLTELKFAQVPHGVEVLPGLSAATSGAGS
ncbi:MAG: DUF881 domain-containing protein [Cellulomonas sp.]